MKNILINVGSNLRIAILQNVARARAKYARHFIKLVSC